mmetsp:Transcript_59472/g.145603  ORF Transcript_59472/g.145603 Transcript_59472/m.145603 type:complete len:99 (+) Transcript_59472:6252-6548(+)
MYSFFHSLSRSHLTGQSVDNQDEGPVESQQTSTTEGQRFDEFLQRSSHPDEDSSDEVLYFPKFLDDATFYPPLHQEDNTSDGVVVSSSSTSAGPSATT